MLGKRLQDAEVERRAADAAAGEGQPGQLQRVRAADDFRFSRGANALGWQSFAAQRVEFVLEGF